VIFVEENGDGPGVRLRKGKVELFAPAAKAAFESAERAHRDPA